MKSLLLFLILLVMVVCVLYMNVLNKKNAILAEYLTLRKQYGALSCKCNGVGPTGGFCLSKEKADVGGNTAWCKNLAKELRRLFNGQSVYDFGAGLGWYGKALLADDKDGFNVTSYEAFDGAENIESVFPDGFVKHLDLSKPVYMPAKDWVLSLEVGEHIPAQYERTYIDNLHRHNKKGIVLSWAVEGQGGHFHVNNRNNDYIKSIFQRLGYVNDLTLEKKLREMATLSWFRNTIMIFRKT